MQCIIWILTKSTWIHSDMYPPLGFPGGSDGKESACNVGGLGSIPGLGRSPGRGQGDALQYSCLEDLHGQRSLAGCSPWGLTDSDTTEQLSASTSAVTASSFRISVFRVCGGGIIAFRCCVSFCVQVAQSAG